ncbi:unnamed protein product [Rotaria sp. Silwood2]|nr:unnamed protein product [Rotaria sp. Silwood2]
MVDNNEERTNNMLINSKSNMTDDSNPTSSDTSANETMMVTESVTFVSTETYTITPLMACKLNVSNGFTVKVRTSSMFTALIIYNCSSINSSELFVFVNGLDANNCIVTEDISDNMNYTTVNVTCDNIMNNAGRDWTFNMGQKFSDSQTIFNEIFIVTLVPLSLNGSTSIDVTISEDLTSALIFIPNCTDICDVAYLMVHCNDSDLSNQTLLNSCTHTCSNIQPGSIYNFSLVRLPIRIVDKIEDEHDNEFQEEILYREYQTNLDKVSNFKFENDYHDNKTAWIYFNRPRGNFHKIYLNCSIQDQRCSNDRIILTNETDNCSNCNFITISPITRGVSYQCHAITIKENFLNVISDKFNFVTDLEPVINEDDKEIWVYNTTRFSYNLTTKSDFDHLESICIPANNQYPCETLTEKHDKCVTILENDGVYGCDYHCSFITKKLNYTNNYSKNYTVVIFPPMPILSQDEITSRSITIKWKISQPTHFESFEVIRNLTDSVFPNKTTFSYTWKELLPNRGYKFRVLIYSPRITRSEALFVNTSEEAPGIPNSTDILNKIILLNDHSQSQSEQYVIEIDPSLFSNEYGIIKRYLIYVRQNLNKNTSMPSLIGSYYAALNNNSIDYLALNIPISPSDNSFLKSDGKLRLILGNDTCQNNSNANIPCNEKLKADTNYKIILSACTAAAGCTSVLSNSFRTKIQNQLPESSKSIVWFIVIPILVVLIIAVLITLSRKHIKNWCTDEDNIDENGKSIQLRSLFRPIRPKPLVEYLNIDRQDENKIYDEFKELEKISPHSHQSDSDPNFAAYDRYRNIPARGSWEQTAVYLTGEHRLHDYINANEITSFDRKRKYIACQGPLQETCEDFWEMIIQYRVPKIVMLTRTEERHQARK